MLSFKKFLQEQNLGMQIIHRNPGMDTIKHITKHSSSYHEDDTRVPDGRFSVDTKGNAVFGSAMKHIHRDFDNEIEQPVLHGRTFYNKDRGHEYDAYDEGNQKQRTKHLDHPYLKRLEKSGFKLKKFYTDYEG